MNLRRVAGHVLLWVGFLAGVFFAVRSTEVAGQPWATIHWPSYTVMLLVAIGGVVLLRATRRAARLGGRKHAEDMSRIRDVLLRLGEQIADWAQSFTAAEVFDIHRRIDQNLSDDLALFADLRESLIDLFGLSAYAGIMTEFALAERTINRAWSASADGYADEVAACLTRAVEHLREATVRLQAASDAAAASDV